ncbi:hypothetical protein AMECASPLE_031176 [Ameca splendens]|uniref:Uncharacterized protein n=1 Tax=Ameca splendens TaxID=208324 RepID=A0ABV1AEB4_9TELE
MSGNVMEMAEGGVRGWGGKDWGAKRSPREPAPRLNPIGTPVCQVPTKEGGIGTSTGQKLGTGNRPREPTENWDQRPPTPSPEPPRPSDLDPQPRYPVRCPK